MKIALLGYGRMGKTIAQLTEGTTHEIVFKTSEKFAPEELTPADVAIDFSIADAALFNIEACFKKGIPVVSGTTGWLNQYERAIETCRQNDGSFLYASNFSIGVNLFFQLNKNLAAIMKNFTDYEVDIEEIHHTKKRDKPSGTAITLAEDLIALTDKTDWKLTDSAPDKTLKKNHIPVVAKRYEDVKGTHKINYRSAIDAIEIKHTAFSRAGFAKGALLAAAYIKDKKGIFTMKDVLDNLI